MNVATFIINHRPSNASGAEPQKLLQSTAKLPYAKGFVKFKVLTKPDNPGKVKEVKIDWKSQYQAVISKKGISH